MQREKSTRKISAKRNKLLKGGSLSRKLILSFTLVLLIPSLIIGLASYESAETHLREEITSSANENVQLLNSLIDATVQSKKEQADFLASRFNQDLFQDPAYGELRTQLEDFYNTTEGLVMVYVGTSEGKMIDQPVFERAADYDPRKRPWYKEAMEHQGESVITAPYVDAATGKYVITVASVLKDGSGVVGFDVEVANLQKTISQAKIGEKGYPFVVDADGKMAFHPSVEPGSELPPEISGPMSQGAEGKFTYESDGISKQMIFVTNATTGWKIAGTMDQAEARDTAKPILDMMLWVIAIMIFVGGFFVFLVIRSIMKPIRQMAAVTKKVSEGDLTEQVEVIANDEIGQLGTSFNHMLNSLRELLTKINQSAQHLASSTQQLNAGSEQTAQTTKEVTIAIQEVAAGAETQMTSAEESARAMEEISAGVQRIAESSSLVSDSSITASKNASEGNAVLEEVTAQMRSINQSVQEGGSLVKLLGNHSQQIGRIIEVITQISDQTNLLALNAAIEAARAGEHGRGFAVVADEVRKLAEESKQSANQIADLIRTVQADTDRAVAVMAQGEEKAESGLRIVDTAGQSFQSILQSIQQVSGEIQEIAATSQEMSASTEEITASVEEVASIASEAAASTNQVAASAHTQLESIEQITQSIHELSKLAMDLQDTVNRFKM
ncbi:methyl-accepting chemotaxis protein [Priestia abyssalis]|uniref:methyl-accepting chemotaxis protein n=1 Tax=Priestia abyssalis TaxID=1221450 RepID=UPI0009959CA8|nr:methyl-accepting chemotaxis protein [Priestia abyssalis]